MAALEGSGVRSAGVGGIRIRGVRLGAPVLPNGQHGNWGCVRGSVRLGRPVPVRGSVGPKGVGSSPLCVCVCLRIHVAGCVVLRMLEHCAALGQCIFG